MDSPVSSVAPSASRSRRSKLSLSLDSISNLSTAATSVSSLDHRWSDVVPPKSALTFAAVWDPKDGMVTFSGARLLDAREDHDLDNGPPSLADLCDDERSQMLSMDPFGDVSSENTATLATFQDVFKSFLHRVPKNPRQFLRHRRSQTVASSTFNGLDVYTEDMPLAMNRRIASQYSRFDQIDGQRSFLPHSAFKDTDSDSESMSDGDFEEEEYSQGRNLKSRFSTTTTSTSNYIEVERFRDNSSFAFSAWTALDAPSLSIPECPTPPPSPRRRLKKRQPVHSPPTLPYLGTNEQRRHCRSNSSESSPPTSPPTSPCGSEKVKLTKFAQHIRNTSRYLSGRGPFDDEWVCIEITPTITQRIVVSPARAVPGH
ncbi:hypothetical protein SERLA73DRAFT_158137 [Serpula lacrymans var. lacrymans S7.3]|uniref:Uncharacterized protein n=2 Tax=Serpula lacrymans var. lacrymans TaxID=341189 RepID=F8PK60_SERL3|nr:uncharacterized protein SERLADRAFT_456804 [Serpula lacrymans var. lacrymans S7.9]EGO03514.1 hypothetical protein SERLA73DRAFT_158137 [Serpula lacrymans var. lacrymans S7.3]EGO29264.1 hypothetical protein SERLADRAFT_456804 [Serpula lacrymans var. lacrymans S7.9]